MTARPSPKQLADAKAVIRREREARRAERAPRVEHEQTKPHQNRERDHAYLAFLRRQPCSARHLGDCDGPIEAAHLRFSDPSVGRVNPGMQRKSDDRWALPLCRHHHAQQHGTNERRWWAEEVKRDPNALAIESYAAWEAMP